MWLRIVCITALLTGCGAGKDGVDVPDGDAALVTWYRTVQPLVMEHCSRCHDGSGVAPGDLTDYAVASSMADLMVARIQAGDMPPPAADPECADYVGSERMTLTPEEQAVFGQWAAAGAPEGDPADATETDLSTPTIVAPDIEAFAAAPYVPAYQDFDNEYRCFILDIDIESDLFLTAIEPIIDQVAISHHSVLFMDPSGTAAENITDEATASWDCPQVIPDGSWLPAYAWAPGNNMIEMPEGFGMRVRAGTQFVLQMHYYAATPEVQGTEDLPGYAFRTAETVSDEITLLPLGPTDFTIPAGEDAFTISESYALGSFLGTGLKFYGAFPHMHVLGSRYSFRVEGGLQDRCVSEAQRYDFDNQPTYWFKEPVAMTADQSLVVDCTYDNSASNPNQINDPPVDVYYGERTDQEMCFALLYASFGL